MERFLGRLIPRAFRVFPKLTGGGPPYRFERWDRDRDGLTIMRYSFPSRDGESVNGKRVWAREIQRALASLIRAGALNRHSFEEHCPRTSSDGGCGFAVIGRILERLGVAAYEGGQEGFRLVNPARANRLLRRQ